MATPQPPEKNKSVLGMSDKEARAFLQAQKHMLEQQGYINLSDEILPGVTRGQMSHALLKNKLSVKGT